MTNWRPRELPPALLAALAVGGLLALMLVLLLLVNLFNLFNAPPASPSPRPTRLASGAPTTTRPGASPTAQPTNSTAAPPSDTTLTPPPTPAGSLTPEQALVAHVPEPIRATCTVEPGGGRSDLVARCAADGGALALTYFQYADAETMAVGFANRLSQSQIEPNTGRCEDLATWPAESEYRVGGQITGRRLCTEQPGAVTIYWTDDRLNIMGQLVDEGAGFDRLIDFWTNESGPIP